MAVGTNLRWATSAAGDLAIVGPLPAGGPGPPERVAGDPADGVGRLSSSPTSAVRGTATRRAAPYVVDEAGWSTTDRIAVWLTHRLGSMGTVWITLAASVAWMVLGARVVVGFDPYPYPVLLFAGNVVQLLLIFVILVGQRILTTAGERRAQQTYDDTQAILAECHRLQEHIETQNRVLNRGAPAGHELDPCDTAPIRIAPPQTLEPAATSASRRFAARLVGVLGSTGAVVLTTVLVAAWTVLALLGVIPDPYPFPFLLFCSSLAQLVLMFVIMVGQDVLGEAADRRVVETAEHTTVVLQQCRHLRQHLVAQDEVIAGLVAHVAPTDRPATQDGTDDRSAPAPRLHDDGHDRTGPRR